MIAALLVAGMLLPGARVAPLEQVNAWRVAHEMTTVVADYELSVMAQEWADAGTFQHRPEGDLRRRGFRAMGEVICRTGAKFMDCLRAWERSPTHLAALSYPSWDSVGIGIGDGMIVVNFGDRR